jgi:hypothetical protein
MNNISVLYSEEELALSVKKLGAEDKHVEVIIELIDSLK